MRKRGIVATLCGMATSVMGFCQVHLVNDTAEMKISLSGGVITEMNLKAVDVKPIHEYGHFICFDRWGPSSPEDEALGIPWHGEGSKVDWTLDREPSQVEGGRVAAMSGKLPIVNMGISRKIYLDAHNPVFLVEEELTNYNEMPKVFNLVQHPTIGAPFLDENTIVDTRVDSGFSQAGSLPPAADEVIHWPEDTVDGAWADLRYLKGEQSGGKNWWAMVVSFILDEEEEYAWTTAVNPTLGLMVGYLWPTADYPWMNYWFELRNQAPSARGLEFGSTGMHQAWPEIFEVDSIFGKALYQELEPGESHSKSYYAFLSHIPSDYQGVSSVQLSDSTLRIEEYGQDPSRSIEMDVRGLLHARQEIPDYTGVESYAQDIQMEVYPNPFGQSLSVKYFLNKACEVSIRIFDLSGSLVGMLEEGFMEAGRHRSDFVSANLAPGMYLLEFGAGTAKEMKRIVHIK